MVMWHILDEYMHGEYKYLKLEYAIALSEHWVTKCFMITGI